MQCISTHNFVLNAEGITYEYYNNLSSFYATICIVSHAVNDLKTQYYSQTLHLGHTDHLMSWPAKHTRVTIINGHSVLSLSCKIEACLSHLSVGFGTEFVVAIENVKIQSIWAEISNVRLSDGVRYDIENLVSLLDVTK